MIRILLNMLNIDKNKKNEIALVFIILLSSANIFGNDLDRIINLNTKWKFAIGDYQKWASPTLNDDDWETISVPSEWENQGFPGYDGYAWYRTEFTLDAIYENDNIYLNLGYIDDVDEVYINGILVGFSGAFPPNYWTAYNAKRLYNIPREIIKFDKSNTIAVRVYDAQLGGGIVSGDIGIYVNQNIIAPELDLSGIWDFKIGDNLDWSKEQLDTDDWMNTMVPGFWRYIGYAEYDGFAWYRKKFYFNMDQYQNYVLVLGKIDDLDEVYINGTLVGSTGDLDSKHIEGTEYNKFRVYYLIDFNLKENENNVIAVRVYDGRKDGGIYEGPIGIMKRKTFQKYMEQKNTQHKRKNKSIWDVIFN